MREVASPLKPTGISSDLVCSHIAANMTVGPNGLDRLSPMKRNRKRNSALLRPCISNTLVFPLAAAYLELAYDDISSTWKCSQGYQDFVSKAEDERVGSKQGKNTRILLSIPRLTRVREAQS